jgi:general secretion pathway protein F
MPAFKYQALDKRGETRAGTLRAGTERDVRLRLARRNLVPVDIAATSEQGIRDFLKKLMPERMSPSSLALITRQMATLVRVVPVDEALRTVALQTEAPGTRNILQATHTLVLEGYRLSEAMARQGKAFPPLYRSMIAAGESSGALAEILERLAVLLEREQDMRSKILTATIYPALLTLTAIIVIILLMTFVVPRVVEQFDSMGQTLPFLTRMVIFISEAMRSWGLLLLAVLAGAGIVFARALRDPRLRLRVDTAMLRLPVIGGLVRKLNAVRLARTLATMTASGLPIIEGLTLSARTIGNRALREATESMASAIGEGGSLSSAMRRAGVFPPILIHMTASGEGSGKLEAMLSSAADYLEREFNAFTAVALSLLEPLIIIVMGILVTMIVLSILLPILQLNTLAIS